MLGNEDARLWWKSFWNLVQAIKLRCEVRHLKSERKVEAIPSLGLCWKRKWTLPPAMLLLGYVVESFTFPHSCQLRKLLGLPLIAITHISYEDVLK